ncbi:MAG: hypothetical protein BWY06_01185 [Candidatus Latescibacteria bacterium ADurb.Bin168]|nr:MAG: hypothetical protein BWY06_01185 [Candidatus Latescibacteria bacterium ADurb.Bin168]
MTAAFVITGAIVLIAAVAVIVWFFTGRRPPRLDPRSERLIESLVQLQRDNPRRATEVFARALVRAGLVWEKDIQTGGASAQTERQLPYRESRRDQPQRQNFPRNEQRVEVRASAQQAAQRPEIRDTRTGERAGSPAASGDKTGSPQPATHSSRRRRRRRPSGTREQQPGGPPQQTTAPPSDQA